MSKIINKDNFNKTFRYLKKNGVSSAYFAAKERVAQKKSDTYVYLQPDKMDLIEQRAVVSDTGKGQNAENPVKWPFITVVMPAFETKTEYLKAAIESLVSQSYVNWELVIADASKTDSVRDVVAPYEENDSKRIRYIHLDSNDGISENTNRGIDEAKGDYIAFLDHDDVITPDALFHVAKAILDNPQGAIFYSDEDKTDSGEKDYFDANLKYDFNYDLLLSNNYICHLMTIRAEILRNIRLRKNYDGSQDYDLVLQIIRFLTIEKNVRVIDLGKYIIHIPRVLYHWRCHEESTALNTDSKLYAYRAGIHALGEHIDSTVDSGRHYIHLTYSKHLGFYDVDWTGETFTYTSAEVEAKTIFELRPEIGAVIGRVYDDSGCMDECILNEDGEWLYAGLHKKFSGYLNRFSCNQNVFAADIRYMTCRDEVRALLKRFINEKGITKEDFRTGKDIRQISMEFGQVMKDAGYMILYIPIKNR